MRKHKHNMNFYIGLTLVLLVGFMVLVGLVYTPYDPNAMEASAMNQSPSLTHWFGTDEQGRDIFSRIIDGTRVSLSVGLEAVGFALVLGTIFGAVAGYKGGKTDNSSGRYRGTSRT